MLLGHNSQIEDYIIKVLDQKPQRGPLLVDAINASSDKKLTKQAVYASLRKLLDQEVVTKSGTLYTLNRVWLQKLYQFSKKHIQLGTPKDYQTVLDFEDGDSVTYKFKNPHMMDIMWGHLYDLVYEITDPHQVIINHHPHEWLILGRTETETYWLNRYNNDQKMLLFNIGGNTELDKLFKHQYSSDYIKINTGVDYGFRPNQYLAVVGDYIFDISVEHGFEQAVDDLFQQDDISDLSVTKKAVEQLAKSKYSSKLKLTKNPEKAAGWRKTFAVDYAIQEPYHI